MEDCLFSLVHLQENNMVHADLRPELISVPIKRGQNFKILDRLRDPAPPNQVQINNIKAKRDIYMSPALFHAISAKEPKVRHNPFKSDIFSLGMILLEAGLLESVQSVYCYENGEINNSKLVDFVEKFFLKYNRNFILQEILLVMLEFSQKLRQEPIKLLKTLQSLRDSKIEDSQLFNEVLEKKQNTNIAMDNIEMTPQGFQIKETKMTNLSILHGLNSFENSGKENSLKQSLVEMLKNRTSHNLSKVTKDLDKLSEKEEFRNSEENEIIDEDSNLDPIYSVRFLFY